MHAVPAAVLLVCWVLCYYVTLTSALLWLTLQDWLQVPTARFQVVLACIGCAAATIFACIVIVFFSQMLLQLPHWSVRRIQRQGAVIRRLQARISTAARLQW
jgi:hypothetical protein